MNLEARDLSFSYGSEAVLQRVSFTARQGELLAVLGPNGAGKSTLFRLLLGLEKRGSGVLLIDGKPVDSASAGLAKQIAFVPQSHSPSFNYSVADMVLMGTTIHVNGVSSPGAKQRAQAMDAMDLVGISHLRDRGYLQISGGERQLVLIARALAQRAGIIVMDEPTASLDYGNQLRVLARVKALARSGYTVIQSTHNPDHAFLFADRVLALHNRRVAACGAPCDVLTGELINTLYGVKVTVQRGANGMLAAVPDMAEYQFEKREEKTHEKSVIPTDGGRDTGCDTGGLRDGKPGRAFPRPHSEPGGIAERPTPFPKPGRVRVSGGAERNG